MAARINYLGDLANWFAGLSDSERLDHATVMAQRFRQMVDGIRSGEFEATPALHDLLLGAAEALEALTAGRAPTGEGDGGRDDE